MAIVSQPRVLPTGPRSLVRQTKRFVIIMEDYYKILNINPYADTNTIKTSYRKLAKQYHPDRNPNNDTTTYMQKINNAYDVLCDPTKRSKYDTIYFKNKASRDNFKDVSVSKRKFRNIRRRADEHPRVTELRARFAAQQARDNEELQNILDDICSVLPNDEVLRKLAELHRENPESCSYKYKQYEQGL